MRTMKLCDASTLLDGKKKNKDNEALWHHSIVVWGKKRMRTMKLCGATALLYGNKWNEYNEALWQHNIVGWEEKD